MRDELQAQAQARGIGLATLLRELATTAAREARRARIREASVEVGRHILTSPDARAVCEDWGTPQADAG